MAASDAKEYTMEKYPRRVFVRMSNAGHDHATALADEMGLTLSQLVRTLLDSAQPARTPPGTLVLVDRVSAAHVAREMRRWGHHYNQGIHALNKIAYYLKANDMDSSEVVEELERAASKLDAVREGSSRLDEDVRPITAQTIAFL